MKRLLGTLTAALLAMFMFAGAAGADPILTPNPIPVSPAQTSVSATVTVDAPPANTLTFITQCKKSDADPTFTSADCSNFSEILINPNPTAAGLVKPFSVFRGTEPTGDESWGCFEAGDTAPAGITKYTNCFIRVAYGSEQNYSTDKFTPFTFTASGALTPEAPVAIMLPLFAALVLGGGVFMQRRRTQTVSV